MEKLLKYSIRHRVFSHQCSNRIIWRDEKPSVETTITLELPKSFMACIFSIKANLRPHKASNSAQEFVPIPLPIFNRKRWYFVILMTIPQLHCFLLATPSNYPEQVSFSNTAPCNTRGIFLLKGLKYSLKKIRLWIPILVEDYNKFSEIFAFCTFQIPHRKKRGRVLSGGKRSLQCPKEGRSQKWRKLRLFRMTIHTFWQNLHSTKR